MLYESVRNFLYPLSLCLSIVPFLLQPPRRSSFWLVHGCHSAFISVCVQNSKICNWVIFYFSSYFDKTTIAKMLQSEMLYARLLACCLNVLKWILIKMYSQISDILPASFLSAPTFDVKQKILIPMNQKFTLYGKLRKHSFLCISNAGESSQKVETRKKGRRVKDKRQVYPEKVLIKICFILIIVMR